jgi:endonuclease YncB( thermonuclease family)
MRYRRHFLGGCRQEFAPLRDSRIMHEVTRRKMDEGTRRNPVRFVGTLLPIAVLLIAGVAMFQQELGSGSASGDRAGPPGSDVVVRVVDGDTVELQSTGKSRLIGVDTPEVYGGQECFGREASAFAKRVLRPGLRVRVERDVEERDRYGRTLIYLRLPDGRSFNELLVAEGYAVPLTIPPNVRHAERFVTLARRARKRAAGLWSSRSCDGDPDRPAG